MAMYSMYVVCVLCGVCVVCCALCVVVMCVGVMCMSGFVGVVWGWVLWCVEVCARAAYLTADYMHYIIDVVL